MSTASNNNNGKETLMSMNPDNYEYSFDNTIDVVGIYKKIVDELSTDQELYQELLKCYVTNGEQVLKSISKRDGIKAGKNVKFDKMTGIYRSSAFGFVVYDGMKRVSVIPVINVADKWRGVMVLPPQKSAKKQLDAEQIQGLISEIPIKLMVDYDAVTDLANKNINNNEGVVCIFTQGQKPIDGNVQKVILDYDLSIGSGKTSDDGSIDFKERSFVHNIEADVKIAHIIPAKEAVNGLDIYNEVLPAHFDEDPCYKMGQNLKVDADGITVRSAIKGILIDNHKTLSVSNVVEIDKVDLSTGNIDVDGSVIIKENVTPGFSIMADGDIQVNGNIEDCKIHCSGNLIVSGGIIGGPDSDINVSGKIYSSFIRNAKVLCKGDVIANQIVNSDIACNDRVIALDGKGVIIGGSVKALNGIWAKSIGAVSESKTMVVVGRDAEADNILKNIINEIKFNNDEISKIKAIIGTEYFKNPKAFLEKIPVAKRDTIKDILKRITNLIKTTKELELKKDEMLAEFDKLDDSVISATENVYPGITVYISNLRRYIDKQLSGTMFYYSKETKDIREKAPKSLPPEDYAFPENINSENNE